MRRSRVLCLVFIFSICSTAFLSAADETLTITTYYPSPYGVYKTLRLYPDTARSNPCANRGEMYFNDSNSQLYVCSGASGSSTWQSAGGGGYWTLIGNDIYNNNNSGAGNVGIGTNGAPKNKLDVEGGLAVGVDYSGTSSAPMNGAIIQGSVGIGTALPGGALDVQGGTAGVNQDGLPITLHAQDVTTVGQYGGNIILQPGRRFGTAVGKGKVCIDNACISTWGPYCDWTGDRILGGVSCVGNDSYITYGACTNNVLAAVSNKKTTNGCLAPPPPAPPYP